jgi:hypothetical protein
VGISAFAPATDRGLGPFVSYCATLGAVKTTSSDPSPGILRTLSAEEMAEYRLIGLACADEASNELLLAAHENVSGAKRTCHPPRFKSALAGEADIGRSNK